MPYRVDESCGFDQTFLLAIIIIKAVGTVGHRTLQSICHSKITDKKWYYLIDLNNGNNNPCFASSLTGLGVVRDLTDVQLLVGAKERPQTGVVCVQEGHTE